MNWPNDADGDVFRRLEADGFNFNNEHEIDFNLDFDFWPLSPKTIELIQKLFPTIEIIDPDEEDIENGELVGYMQFKIIEKLTYELVVRTQKITTDKVKEFGGRCESWGVLVE